MKNPPDSLTIGITGLCSLITLAYIAYQLFIGIEGHGTFSTLMLMGTILAAFASVFFITIGVISEVVMRPYNVEVGEDIRFDWRFKESTTKPIDSVANLFIEPKAKKSALIRRSGGSVGFKGQKRRIGLTYEITKAIEDKYVEKLGHVPPLPNWAKKVE